MAERSRELASHYGEWYYAERVGDQPYRRGNAKWHAFFGGIADAIVAEFAPRTVLDAGCGIGFLVEALRARGVEARGFDVSRYAIDQIPEQVRRFCTVASITDEIDGDYDLIVCIEVLEHLPAEAAEAAVANLARHTDLVLFYSTPDDFREPTHLNVRPPEYWVGLFGRHGLFRDLDVDVEFVAPHALVLRREGQTPVSVARQYERERARLVTEVRTLRDEVIRVTEELDRLRSDGSAPGGSALRRRPLLRRLPQITRIRARAFPYGRARHRLARRAVRAVPGGKRLTWALRPPSLDEQYALWLERTAPDDEAFARLRAEATSLASQPLISVVMPVHETDPALLDAAITSVRDQLYGNWELCIADDASTRRATRDVLDRAAAADERVRVRRLEERAGIAGASNAALALASGDFVALLDHDDELKPDALLEVAKLLNRYPDLDYVYSDEDKRKASGEPAEPFFKPDWSPDLELSINYVTHLSVYRRDLVERVGAFREGFDGSQDYDLVLRVTEQTDRIAHVPRVLYTWRMTAGSAAGDAEAKPYAFESAKRALREAVERRKVDAVVTDGRIRGSYRVRRRLRAGGEARVVRIGAADTAGSLNDAAAHEEASILVFLEEGLEIHGTESLDALVEHAQREDVAAVGARIFGADGLPEHEGVIVGLAGSARATDCAGYFGLGEYVRNVSAVGGGCLATRRDVFEELGGFDASYTRSFADVDYCLRARLAGYWIVYTPYAEVRRTIERPPLDEADERTFRARWIPEALPDPFYNPNLSLEQPFALSDTRPESYALAAAGTPRAASSRR